MAHELESMFYVADYDSNGVIRNTPWHGLGTPVQDAPTSEEAIKLAGLDWLVEPKPIYTDSGIQIPGYVANTRNTDNSILGIVSDKYTIVQNHEAFKFTDELIGEGVKYETAGSLKNGKSIFLLARLPRTNILGDDIDPFLCFNSTHDGTGAVRVCMTPVRVVCNNTLNLALNTAKRTWSCKHMGRIEDKLHEATETLGLANKYMRKLAEEADVLAHTRLTDDQIRGIVDDMFPINSDDTERHQTTMRKAQQEFYIAYYMPDIEKFRNTAYGVVNAMADMVAHASPNRKTSTYQERNFERIVYGHPLLDGIHQLAMSKAK